MHSLDYFIKLVFEFAAFWQYVFFYAVGDGVLGGTANVRFFSRRELHSTHLSQWKLSAQFSS